MYKYERKKIFLKSEPYSCDYRPVYGGENPYCAEVKGGRRFTALDKRKKHLEKLKGDNLHRFSKTPKTDGYLEADKKKNNMHVFSGLFRFIFACVVLTAFLIAFAIAVSVLDKGEEALGFKNYDDIIWPVVMQDPQPFDETSPPDKEIMLKASLWELAMERKNMSDAWNEEQQLVLPKNDVESAGEKLFGKEQDFGGLDCNNSDFYKFDNSKNTFIVEPISGTDGFLPHTINACYEGDDVVLKVGYVSPKNQFNSKMNSIFENKIEKYAKYRLKKNLNTGNFYVLSVS